jgi:hypothetical protein
MPRQIGEDAYIAAVHTRGGSATEWAEGPGGCCRHEDGDSGTVKTEQIETETRGVGKNGGRHEPSP